MMPIGSIGSITVPIFSICLGNTVGMRSSINSVRSFMRDDGTVVSCQAPLLQVVERIIQNGMDVRASKTK